MRYHETKLEEEEEGEGGEGGEGGGICRRRCAYENDTHTCTRREDACESSLVLFCLVFIWLVVMLLCASVETSHNILMRAPINVCVC